MEYDQEIKTNIGKRIKTAREAAGLTQERFSELIDVGEKNVSAIERGVVGISITTLIRICEVLSVSSDMLLFGAKSENSEAEFLLDRLNHLTPAQFAIARDVINKLIEAFALQG